MQSNANEKPCFQLFRQKLKQPTSSLSKLKSQSMSSSWPAWTIIDPEDSLDIETPLTPLKRRKWKQLFYPTNILLETKSAQIAVFCHIFPVFTLKPVSCPFLCKVTICLLGTWILASENFTFCKWIISILPLAVLLTACLQLIPLERWPRLLQCGRGWPARYPSLHNTAT